MDDRPFPTPRQDRHGERKPTRAWAERVWAEWRACGFPDLIGAPAEQVREATRILNGRQMV